MSAAITLSAEPKRLSLGGLFSAEEYAEIDRQRARLRAEALSWLSDRFQCVREEEVGDRLAEAVRTIREWDAECATCTGAKCRHSRAVLVISEEYRGGFRSFVVRAKPCGMMSGAAQEEAVNA